MQPRRCAYDSRQLQQVPALDEAVGNITAALDANDAMWSKSVLVLVGDNGGQVYSGDSNAPLRGGKFSWFEGGTRQPLSARYNLIKKKTAGFIAFGLACRHPGGGRQGISDFPTWACLGISDLGLFGFRIV